MDQRLELSVIIAIIERFDEVKLLFNEYKQFVEQTGLSYEFIYVLDGPNDEIENSLKGLIKNGEKIRVITFANWFGGATAFKEGFAHSRGDLVLFLPAYRQAHPSSIPEMVKNLGEYDVVSAWRYPRRDSPFKLFQTVLFNSLMTLATDRKFHDIGCMQLLLRRKVMDEVVLYGDQHRYISLLAYRRGFKVKELKVPQSEFDRPPVFYSLGIYVRRLLDFLSVMFVIKFTKKPLRFFGLLGVAVFLLGSIIALILIFQRLVNSQPLAERPIIIIPAILISLGVHLFTAGLIGEIIIFTHAGKIKEYTVEKIIN